MQGIVGTCGITTKPRSIRDIGANLIEGFYEERLQARFHLLLFDVDLHVVVLTGACMCARVWSGIFLHTHAFAIPIAMVALGSRSWHRVKFSATDALSFAV